MKWAHLSCLIGEPYFRPGVSWVLITIKGKWSTVDWWRQTWSWYWLDPYSVIKFYNRLIIPPNTSPANICIHLYEEQLPQITRFTHVIKLGLAQSFSLAFIMLSPLIFVFSLFLWWFWSRNIDLCFRQRHKKTAIVRVMVIVRLRLIKRGIMALAREINISFDKLFQHV